MKCECGLTYVPGHPDDEEHHRIVHSEYLSGPEIRAISLLSSIGEIKSYPFYVVDWKIPKEISSFSSRLATIKDVDRLIEICQSDPNVRNAFPTQEAWETYFKDRVLKDGHAVMVFKGNQVVAASAPLRLKPDGIFLRGNEERIIMRFQATRPGNQDAWKRLLIELAKEIVAAGWTDLPLREDIYFSTNSLTATILAKQKPEVEETQIILSYQP